jgi:hypothetical protein
MRTLLDYEELCAMLRTSNGETNDCMGTPSNLLEYMAKQVGDDVDDRTSWNLLNLRPK